MRDVFLKDSIMNLDDILGELSCLEEQLDLQQEEFARVTSQVRPQHHLGGTDQISHTSTKIPSGTLYFSPQTSDTFPRPPNGDTFPPPPPNGSYLPNMRIAKQSETSPEYSVPVFYGTLSRNGTSGPGTSQKGFQDGMQKDAEIKSNERHYAEIGENGSWRQSDSTVDGVTVSGSSSRNSAQSFGSDSFGSDPASARLFTEVVSFPGVLSESLNSFGTISSHGSHSSTSSGNSASPGKTLAPVRVQYSCCTV